MGGTWLPDPSFGSSNEITEPPIHIIDSDSDDTEIVENEHATTTYYEYRLLTDGEYLPDSDEIPQPDNNLEEDSNPVTNDIVENSATAESSEAQSEEKTEITPRDITIDCDQIRAAMAQITLPPSATPSWAVSISDSEWHTFLQNRIRSLQTDNDKSTDSK